MMTLPVAVLASVMAAGPTPMNTLTAAETAAGWRLLFDGKTGAGWHGYKQSTFPEKGWNFEDGALHLVKGGGGGDLASAAQYSDFELDLEFKCAPGANSGIMYRVAETKDYPWMTGPEFQLLDDGVHEDGKDAKHRVGSLYDLVAAPDDKPPAKAGEWNHARIRVVGGVLQHFLNGKKVVECRADDEGWKGMIAGSKFKQWPGFGMEASGHIDLQDHGDEVWFRNIKARDLSGTAKMPREVALFNGRNLAGWTAIGGDGGDAGKDGGGVWSVVDGVLVCKGEPAGYLRTEAGYTSYVLKMEWRFNPETKKAGNSGVLLRVQGPDKVWPRCVEAQLLSGHAGDLYAIDGFTMTTDEEGKSVTGIKHTHAAERAVGEWNEYEIILDGQSVLVNINGEGVNRAGGCTAAAGKIGLQSEGVEIQFRRVRLSPIGEP